MADGGTVFLDEVGELVAEARAMMLRFLHAGEARPVGGIRTLRFDVRVLSATHRSLAAAVRDGTFREDLYYRLRRGRLKVPPLRQRREDIPLLVALQAALRRGRRAVGGRRDPGGTRVPEAPSLAQQRAGARGCARGGHDLSTRWLGEARGAGPRRRPCTRRRPTRCDPARSGGAPDARTP